MSGPEGAWASSSLPRPPPARRLGTRRKIAARVLGAIVGAVLAAGLLQTWSLLADLSAAVHLFAAAGCHDVQGLAAACACSALKNGSGSVTSKAGDISVPRFTGVSTSQVATPPTSCSLPLR